MNERVVLGALLKSWSLESSSLYTEENPARGHCGVTTLVIQDTFGGDILKTSFHGMTHFYNCIGGKVIDFTKSQFETPPTYQDISSNRDEAFADTTPAQYEYLSSRFKRVYSQEQPVKK